MGRVISLALILLVATHSVAARELATAAPEKVGMSSERLERIDDAMARLVADGKLAGAVTMIARRGKVVYFEEVGKMDLDDDRPMSKETLFRIYSMSKPITTVAAMILYEEGRFQLGDPVADYLPAFKETKVMEGGHEVEQDHPFTIKELMSHTAGLSYGWSDTVVDARYRDARILGSENLEQMVAKLGAIPLNYQPGTSWIYSVSADVLGRLVEVVSGMPLDRFLDERLFTPLEMNDTFFEVPPDKLSRFGTNHRYDAEKETLVVIDRPATSRFAKDVTLFSGGGGLVSTAEDYMRFCQMLLNGGVLHGVRILSPKTIELMTVNHLDAGVRSGLGEQAGRSANFGFGLGFGVRTDLPSGNIVGSVGSYNWGGAAGTVFWIDPREELAVVGMIQIMGGRPVNLRGTLQVLTYSAFTE